MSGRFTLYLSTYLFVSISTYSVNIVSTSYILDEKEDLIPITKIWNSENNTTSEIIPYGIGDRILIENNPWLGSLSSDDIDEILTVSNLYPPNEFEYYEWTLFFDENEKYPTYVPFSETLVGIVLTISPENTSEFLVLIVTDVVERKALKAFLMDIDNPVYPVVLISPNNATNPNSRIQIWNQY